MPRNKLVSLPSALAVSLVLSAASCSATVGPPVEGTASVTELRLRWAQWEVVGPESYSYELRRTCFCSAETVTPARVEVRDRRVVDVRSLATGQSLPVAWVPTVDSLFKWAIAEAERGGHVEVAYDRRLSYPVRLVIGTLANDAGVAYSVTKLQALR